MNLLPIVERELRVAARRPFTHWLRLGVGAGVILAGFLCWITSPSGIQAARLAKTLLMVMGFPALTFCLLSGVFLTADCLSREKREGTLGLLFLTDLRGRDVALGKLTATSLHAFYGLLTVLPVMSIPLLMGGVSGGEFLRLTLVLGMSLLFSLSAGLAVSCGSRQMQSAMLVTFGVIGFLAVGTLGLALLATVFLELNDVPIALVLPSPFCAFVLSADEEYTSGEAARFWISLALGGGLGFALLLWAVWYAPRAWREREHGRSTWRQRFWNRLRYGSERWRRANRARLDVNPAWWLASRDRMPQAAGWWLLLVLGWMLAICFVGSLLLDRGSGRTGAYILGLCAAYAWHAVVKLMTAIEASRRWSEDRRSGALELLLASPLPVASLIHGQARGLLRQFRLPLALGALANVLALALLTTPRSFELFHGDARYLVAAAIAGGAVVLATDYRALAWVGMLDALRRRRHHWAVLVTLLRVLLPGVLALLVSWVLVITDQLSERVFWRFLLGWLVACAAYDLVLATWARRAVFREFRHRVTEGPAG